MTPVGCGHDWYWLGNTYSIWFRLTLGSVCRRKEGCKIASSNEMVAPSAPANQLMNEQAGRWHFIPNKRDNNICRGSLSACGLIGMRRLICPYICPYKGGWMRIYSAALPFYPFQPLWTPSKMCYRHWLWTLGLFRILLCVLLASITNVLYWLLGQFRNSSLLGEQSRRPGELVCLHGMASLTVCGLIV